MDIKKVLLEGESETIEFKESFHSTQEISKQICALANTDGGSIFIGIRDNSEVKGLTGNLDIVHQKIANSNQNIHSMPVISSKTRQHGGKHVIEIVVQKSGDSHAHTFEGRVYVRIGTSVRKLEGQTLMDFMKNKHILCFDEIKSMYQLDSAERQKIEYYLALRNNSKYLEQHSVEEFLTSSQLVKSKSYLKNVAVLFFVNNIRESFSQNEIRLVKFAGTEPVEITNQKDFREDIISNIEDALKFIQSNIRTKYVITGKTAKRDEISEYPLEVIREALINAVVHRDYFNPNSIQVNIFDNRLEIINPGGLPEGLTKEFFGRRSVRRNPIMYRLLRDVGFVEGLGTGIPRMVNTMRKASLPDPEFIFDNHSFEVVFYNSQSKLQPVEKFENLNERQIKAIEFLRQNKTIKTQIYCTINKVSVPTAIKDIDVLIKFGFVKKIGKYRGVYYIFNEGKVK
jgi:ATP-dependent DNA helicase RecG